MSQTINLLSDKLINKIAAGEVIESPVSVLKELIENSFDAKSKNISVEIKNGGFQKILIEDDGIGMNEKDASICFLRHATSKIKVFNDLFNISSMGFRGEALASIASISKIILKTSQKELGTLIKIENGKILENSEIAKNKGTSIEVQNLFYNVPVRKKFQKSISYINMKITKTMNLLALSHPHIGFKFKMDDKIIFQTEGYEKNNSVSFEKRVLDILKNEFIKSSIKLDFSENNFSIHGFIGLPLSSKKTKSSQYLFINNRVISNSIISKFIKEAYSTRIGEKEYPIYSLHINVPTEFLDVNVHPQKKEIRFKEEIFIKENIKKAIDQAFFKAFHKKEENSSEINIDFEFDKNFNNEVYIEKENVFKKFEKQQVFDNIFSIDDRFENAIILDRYMLVESKYINDLIEVEEEDKLIIFDLSLIYFTKIFESIENFKKFSKQNLLIPISVELAKEQVDFVDEKYNFFQKIGFDIRIISKTQIVIDSVIDFFNKNDIKEIFLIVLDELLKSNINKINEIYKKKILSKLSKYCKNKKYFSKVEALYLIDLLFEEKKQLIDPLGRQLFKPISEKYLENFFKG